MKKKYIICAPEYSGSAGIRALYLLRDALEIRGYTAKIYCYTKGSQPTQNDRIFINEISETVRNNDIVVYPEIIFGNPLRFKNVVRWVLYFSGVLGGQTSYSAGELVFTWSKEYLADKPCLHFDTIDSTLFYFDPLVEKNVNCFFVHKKGLFRKIPEISECIEITMDFPATRKELGELLRKTKTIYIFDPHTALSEEAFRCGCNVMIVHENSIEEYTPQCFDNEVATKELDLFVRETQLFNYTGEINTCGFDSKCSRFYIWQKLKILKVLYKMTKSPSFLERRNRLKAEHPFINWKF